MMSIRPRGTPLSDRFVGELIATSQQAGRAAYIDKRQYKLKGADDGCGEKSPVAAPQTDVLRFLGDFVVPHEFKAKRSRIGKACGIMPLTSYARLASS
jgi:hypothetical protein